MFYHVQKGAYYLPPIYNLIKPLNVIENNALSTLKCNTVQLIAHLNLKKVAVTKICIMEVYLLKYIFESHLIYK